MFRKLHDPGASAITVFIDGRPVAAEVGESIAAVMLRQSEAWSRRTPVSRERRAPYCMMGVCFDCLVEVDGQGEGDHGRAEWLGAYDDLRKRRKRVRIQIGRFIKTALELGPIGRNIPGWWPKRFQSWRLEGLEPVQMILLGPDSGASLDPLIPLLD